MENNIYFLHDFNHDEKSMPSQKVVFYKLNEDGTHEDGTTLEEMLRVSIERLTDLNSKFPCDENVSAIARMNEALTFLNKRTEDRKARGVEGKHEA